MIPLCEQTLYAWEPIEYAFPVNVIQCKKSKFEVERRVMADRMAQDTHYALVDLGCVPEDRRALLGIVGRMKSEEGMVGFAGSHIPTGIRIVRKGIVAKWPPQVTENYDVEHMQAIQQAGYKVTICPTTYRRILEC